MYQSLRSSLLAWSEPWYWAYGLTGMIKSALALMLAPLIIRHSGSATEIGVVVAAFYLGGLTAPVWGELADRYRLHRVLFAGGMALSGLALTFFASVDGVLLWVSSMFLANIGATMASTSANHLSRHGTFCSHSAPTTYLNITTGRRDTRITSSWLSRQRSPSARPIRCHSRVGPNY